MRAPRPRWRGWLTVGVLLVAIAAAANLLGWDISGWLSDVWDTITTISAGYIVAAVIAMTIQTTATAFAWYSILRFAYPGKIRWRDVLAAYAVSVALNNVLPANIGTLVLLVMFTLTIAGATFAGILGAYAIEKIFFTVIGAFVYLYLFFSVGGSFDIKFAFVHERPVATAVLIGAGVVFVVLMVRRFWPRVVRWWDQAKDGGAILAHPAAYLGRVFLPSLIGWAAMMATNGIFLAAYGIPVTFDTLMRIAGGNSIANVTSVTPGGAGVNQAFNVASLQGVASTADATAYSVANQLVHTAWNIVFAIALMIWAWGWTGGKQLVRESYEDARRREAEQRAKRREKKQAPAAEQEGASA
jgi:uncharacterized membrane protein YbhN (UPF0104 family)